MIFKIYFIFIYLILVFIANPVMAGFAPPENNILPKYIIKEVTPDKLVLNKTISVEINNIQSAWPNPVYSGVEHMKTLRCDDKNKPGSTKIACNDHYLLTFNKKFIMGELENCKARHTVILVNKKTNSKVILNEKLSACIGITGFQQFNDSLWLTSYWSGGHGDYTGDALFSIKINSGEVEFLSEQNKNGWQNFWKNRWGKEHVFSLLADGNKESLWLTSTVGIHQYDLKSKKVTTYHQILFIDEGGAIRVGLKNKRTANDLALFNHMIHLKIVDKKGFAKVWRKTESRNDGNERMHDDMVPFYIETLKFLSKSAKDDYITGTIADRILMINKKKFAPELEKLFFETKSPGQRFAIKNTLLRFGYSLNETAQTGLANDYLLDFVQGDKKSWELCSFYKYSKIYPKDVNVDILNKAGSNLTDFLDRCFTDRQWDFKEQTSKDFLSKLYSSGGIESKEAICRYFNRVRWYLPDNQFLKKVVLDLPIFQKKYGFVLHDCSSWLLNSVTKDEQIVFIQNIKNNDRLYKYALMDLFGKLQRRRNFPIFRQQFEQRIKHEVATCQRGKRNETVQSFAKRCKHKNKGGIIAKPFKGRLVLPPPPKDGKPTTIDRSGKVFIGK